MEQKTILVTGIGGNVGQGVLRNIRNEYPKTNLLGTDVEAFTAGNFLCNKTFVVPYAYIDQYLPKFLEIVAQNNIDLIIPTTDYEVYYLAKNANKIPCKIACLDYKMAEIFLDKYKTYQYFSQHHIPFAKSWNIAEYNNSCTDIIIKPKEGRGSRNLHINPKNLEIFDETFMVQKLYKGEEFTSTVYVNQNGDIHAIITMLRSLENGTTVKAKVVDAHKEEIENLALKIVKSGSIKGSFNIQSIYENDIIPFEINGRISGTNSIRHVLGFKDVVWTIEELLYQKALEKPNISYGIATRILTDTIYVGATSEEEIINQNHPYISY